MALQFVLVQCDMDRFENQINAMKKEGYRLNSWAAFWAEKPGRENYRYRAVEAVFEKE